MDKAKAQQVLARIEEILRWERRMEEHKDQKFAELGKHLCEVRDQGYWRLGYKSFEHYLEAKFPDGLPLATSFGPFRRFNLAHLGTLLVG